MPAINPYLNFDGNTREAMEYYHSIFGGEAPHFMTFGDSDPEGKVSADEKDRIMHTSIKIGENTLMASDTSPSYGNKLQMGNNVYISVNADSREDADKYFNQLSQGGEIEMPMEDMFWGDYFGSTKDKFGVMWMISYTNPTANQG